MQQIRELLSKRYSINCRYSQKIPIKIQYSLRQIEKEIQNNPDYIVPYQNCPICGHEESTLISEMTEFGLAMETQVCGYCGLIYKVGHFSETFMLRYYKYYFYRIKRPGSKKNKLFSFQFEFEPKSLILN